MTADPPPPTHTLPPTQDKLAEIEEHFSDCAECEEAHIPTDDVRWLIEEVKRLRGDNATLSSYIYSMTNPGTLPEVLRSSMQRVEQ